MYRRILAPVDGSPTSNRGLEQAVALAKDQGAELRLLHVIDGMIWTPDLTGMENVSEIPHFLRRRGEQVLEGAKMLAGQRGIDAQTVLHETLGGRVAATILKEAGDWEANIVVMGTHGRRGLGRVVLGSDAAAVVHGASVPVLLVRGGEE
jgi:nucleotide-binding universal stress UspA family protein